MLVSFSANARNLGQDLGSYTIILDAIRRLGHTVANDWVTTTVLRMEEGFGQAEHERWSKVAGDAKLGIEAAEVAIVEATDQASFGAGFEAALALQLKKPCLFLVRKGKEKTSYSFGIESEYLTKKTYDHNSLPKIIEEFLKANTVKAKDLRFNFVVDRQIYNHLAKRSYELRKTKAEIVRDLLLRDIRSEEDL